MLWICWFPSAHIRCNNWVWFTTDLCSCFDDQKIYLQVRWMVQLTHNLINTLWFTQYINYILNQWMNLQCRLLIPCWIPIFNLCCTTFFFSKPKYNPCNRFSWIIVFNYQKSQKLIKKIYDRFRSLMIIS